MLMIRDMVKKNYENDDDDVVNDCWLEEFGMNIEWHLFLPCICNQQIWILFFLSQILICKFICFKFYRWLYDMKKI
jgi:hypothetical protein